jgi:hypothetical protein
MCPSMSELVDGNSMRSSSATNGCRLLIGSSRWVPLRPLAHSGGALATYRAPAACLPMGRVASNSVADRTLRVEADQQWFPVRRALKALTAGYVDRRASGDDLNFCIESGCSDSQNRQRGSACAVTEQRLFQSILVVEFYVADIHALARALAHLLIVRLLCAYCLLTNLFA